ncbi:MAG TPA: PaaI family thioesterase [Allosphingosinicella sp.]|nr:PaaI family thioesterase [Allosphingosinicella sp.]
MMQILQQVNAASPFNAWAGFELLSAEGGVAEVAVQARPDLLQHGGFLHAGLIGGLIDTACGFAAASVAGNVLASQYQVMCYAPAVGERFVARAKVTRAGRRQVFATAELFALREGLEKLVAGGSAVLMVA